MQNDLIRPIIGIENRTAQEVFDIMCDRFRHLSATVPAGDGELVERVARAIAQADEQNGGPPYEYRISLSKHAKEQLFDEARAAIKAVLEAMTAEDSARQNGKEPVVKRLEWIDMGEGPRCITVYGAYAIYPSTSRGRPTLSLSGMPKGLFGKFASIEEAKAAAQADYDARIRSALCDTL